MTLEQRIVLLAQAIGTDVKTLRGTVGVLANLTTTSKSDIVTALNEVLAKTNVNSNAIGTLSTLTTTAKSNLVAALNEVQASVSLIDLTSLINDAAVAGVTTKTFSADRILSLVAGSINQLVDSSPATMDTLRELAVALGNNPNFATTIATSLGNRVRVDAVQTFTAVEQEQARSNISAASIAAVTAAHAAADAAQAKADSLDLSIGNPDFDLALVYTTAKA